MTNFYTADPHFGHESVIKFCGRPFGSVDEMDATILQNYQRAMSRSDDLWIIGDFAFAKEPEKEKLRKMLRSIPGRKHLVTGNHDRPWVRRLTEWSSVHDFIEIKEDGQRISLCHYPLLTWPGIRHGALHLFGHVHNNWQGSKGAINVGVDVFDFKPVRLFDIRKRNADLPDNPLLEKLEPGMAGLASETTA